MAEITEDLGRLFVRIRHPTTLKAGDKLYRHTQQPVVPDNVLDVLQKVARIRLNMNDFDDDRRGIADCLDDAEKTLIGVVSRRAAMLQVGNSPATTDVQVVGYHLGKRCDVLCTMGYERSFHPVPSQDLLLLSHFLRKIVIAR